MELKDLYPQELWSNFYALNAIPRASKKEERVREFMLNFGRNLGLETTSDAIGNVIIKKPATPGRETKQTVILQSHLDMVHQKNTETDFDFATQGIEMFVDGDWVKAKGTTLGADNGIGVAAIMALLGATDIVHPNLEAMFTIDEETGMTGAKQLDPSYFSGSVLLNLDTEEDDELTVGCAGGIDTNTHYEANLEPTPNEHSAFEITVRGLLGGHSGTDIHKGHANANKLVTRLLYIAATTLRVHLFSIDGGSLRNAIPREATATFIFKNSDVDALKTIINAKTESIKQEFQTLELSLSIELKTTPLPASVVTNKDSQKIINALYAAPNGVFRMSLDIENLVEASTNLARVVLKEGIFTTKSLQRSSVESTKEDVSNAVRACFELIGATVTQGGDYPGWKPNPDSGLLKSMVNIYRDRFNTEPKVEACHAGLECGILGAHLPGVEMISFGPTIRGAHSPDERVQISSVKKFWGYLLVVLKEID
jgi:dipeptidase D